VRIEDREHAVPARFRRRIRSQGQPPDPVIPSTWEEV
jgi:hypothetical protein